MLAGQEKALSGFFRGTKTKQLILSPLGDAVKAMESRVLSWPAVTASTHLEPISANVRVSFESR